MRTVFMVLLSTLALLTAVSANALPIKATLYPSSAVVTEQSTLSLSPSDGEMTASFTIPATADPASLRLMVSAPTTLTLADIETAYKTFTDDTRIKAVRSELARTEAERQTLVDTQSAHKAAAKYWQTHGQTSARNTAEAKAMASAVFEGVSKSLSAASALAPRIEDTEKHIAELKRQLNELTGGQEKAILVTARFSGQKASSATVQYSYRLGGCGWKPLYTINASPEQSAVSIAFEAEIYQNSGTRWENVDIALSTARFSSGTTPPEVRPWVIEPIHPRPVAKAMRAGGMQAEMAMMAAAPNDAAPVSHGYSFDEYSTGRTTLESGANRRIALRRFSPSATFDYLIRPHESDKAFVHARVAFDKAPRLPQGEATFLLDSAFIQKRPFALFDKEADLHFGEENQIRVVLDTKDKHSGRSGLISKKQTYDWSWKLAVTNNRSNKTDIRVEDALPMLRDEAISISEELGGATKEDGVAVWTFTLAPDEEKTITYGYSISWPKDMNLSLGGR